MDSGIHDPVAQAERSGEGGAVEDRSKFDEISTPDAGAPPGAPTNSTWFDRQRLRYWLLYTLAWLVTVAMLVAAGLKIFNHDATYILVWLNAFTRYVYLPAYLCLAWALWQHRWVLAGANLGIVACHLAWLVPDFQRDRRFDAPNTTAVADADSSPALRIFFANVRAHNDPGIESILQEIEATNPDVAVLAEFTPEWYAEFCAAPQMQPYKYHTGRSHARVGLVNVFSKLPLQTESQVFIAARSLQTIDVPIGSTTLRIIGLHAPRPMNPIDNYQSFWRTAIPELLAQQGPLVIVGDFNATQYSRVYRELTADHLRSAHEDRGRGYATSWPNGRYLLPPVRIDQALLSPQVECLNIFEGVGQGSDHKPLILDVRLRVSRN